MNPDNKPAGQEMVFDKYVAIALVVGIIAGFIIGNSVGSSKAKEGNNASSTSEKMVFEGNNDATTTTSMSLPAVKQEVMKGSSLNAGEWLVVGEQKAGNYVVLEKITLDKTYWVAVQDSRTTNSKSYVLGAKKLMPGTYEKDSIYVSRATEAGKTYDIVFYQDKGDFNYDPSLMIMNGADPIGATFKAN